MMRTYRYIGIILVCAAAVGCVALLAHSFDGTYRRESAGSVWKERIRDLGPAAAYGQFAEEVAGMPPTLQHERAHEFGGALYEVEGKRGLSTCDSRFSFGCFHEFLGSAIAAEGLSVVDELNEGCFKTLTESPLSCQHGIGHGVLSFLGYGDDALGQALVVCEKLPYSDPIGGCYGGAFMEYNMRTMLGSEGGTRRTEGGDLLHPCDSIPDPYAQACYFWHPQWLRDILDPDRSRDIADIYTEIGDLCRSAGKPYERACFEGVGNNLVADADFDAMRAKMLCDAAAETSTQQLYCRSLAANSLAVGGAGKKGDADKVCDGLRGDPLGYCLSYAANRLNIAMPGDIE